MEHRIIQGGESWLPFARSRIKALQALGLPYASQKFTMPDGALCAIWIEPGQEYIRLSGGGDYVSVFSNVQYPETSLVSDSLAGASGVKLLTGGFPVTVVDGGWYSPTISGKTRFGVTPYNKHFLRMSQDVAEPSAVTLPYSIFSRYGVFVGGTAHNDIFLDGELRERVSLTSPYGGHEDVLGDRGVDPQVVYYWQDISRIWWNTNTAEFIPSVSNGVSAILACVRVESAEEKFGESFDYTASFEDPDPVGRHSETGQRTTSGNSYVQIRLARVTTVNGELVRGVDTLDVGALPYSWNKSTYESMRPHFPGFENYDTRIIVTNDVETTFPYRRWHATERVSAAIDDSIFVLRETNYSEQHSIYWGWSETWATDPLSIYFSRGYALSFVSPTGLVQDNIITSDLGSYGYIDGIFSSSNGKTAYVYYGVHDASETLPSYDGTNQFTFLPVMFTEYLDVITITKDGDAYTLTKTATINVGAVTLRSYSGFVDIDVPENRSDHYESKIHGATQEVNGYIWSDRFCYVVATNEFVEIPDFVEYPPVYGYVGNMSLARKDHITGPEDDRTSYLSVSKKGDRATYVMFKSGLVNTYKLTQDKDTHVYAIALLSTHSITGGYDWIEYTPAEAARFQAAPRGK